MSLQCFYACYSADDEVPSTEPLSIDRNEALFYFKEKVKCDEDFIGFIDAQGNMLQIMMDGNASYWVEIPIHEKRGSFGMDANLEEVSDLLQSLPINFTAQSFPDFEFKAW